MQMPGRKYSVGNAYRYGFNGKENDNDITEGGQDYGMRIYECRLGRFLSVDPLQNKYPDLTPYQFTNNSPIANVDLDGLERYFYKLLIDSKTGNTTLTHLVTEEREPTLTDAFASLFGRNQKDFHGKKYDKTILVQVFRDGVQDYNQSLQFNSFKDLQAWESSGHPLKEITQSDIRAGEVGEAFTQIAINEAYYNYEMSDGKFDGDIGIDISKLFKSKPSKVSEKVNTPAVSVNGGNTGAANANTVTVTIPKSRFPESAANIEKSTVENGTAPTGILNRANAAAQRKINLKGIKTVKGKDRDEAIPAILTPIGKVRVQHINPSDNRGSGAYMGNQLRNVPDGTKVVIKTIL